jgi:phosphatidylserine decarboxylase
MSVVASIRKQLAPVHPEGYLFIGLFALAAVVLGWIWSPLGWIGWILTVWCIYFFRDPPRVTPQREGLVISPADGRVEMVGFFAPPPELELGDRPLARISVFMSVFDCHVNRAPVAGRISRTAYRPGLFLSADLDKASDDNERSGIVIDTPNGRFGVVQIAGLVARRIVSFDNAREGSAIAAGERYGLIRFGSRVDVYLPDGVKPLVGLGQRCIAGETVLADLLSKEAQRTFRVG